MQSADERPEGESAGFRISSLSVWICDFLGEADDCLKLRQCLRLLVARQEQMPPVEL